MRAYLVATAAVGLALASITVRPDSRVTITGSEPGVSIRANYASLRDVLEALAHSHGLRFRISSTLDETRGAWDVHYPDLQTAVTRILRGYDHILVFARGSGNEERLTGAILLTQTRGRPGATPDLIAVPSMPVGGVEQIPSGADAVTDVADGLIDALPPNAAIDAASDRLGRHNPVLRIDAVSVLGRIATEDAVMILAQVALGDRDATVRASAATALRAISSDRSMIFVEAALEDGDSTVRAAAGAIED